MHILILAAAVLSGLIWGIITLQREIRRRQWQKMNTTPLYSIESPRELTAVLLFGLVRCGGDPTSDEKNRLIATFCDELGYSKKDGKEMYSYASYVVGTDANFASKVSKIVEPAIGAYTESQRESTVHLLEALVSDPTSSQIEFLSAVREEFQR